MLKLPKGLKKKKKSKKSKKDQELFTEEELEQYRREHQHQSIAGSSAVPSDSEDHSGGGEKSENDEEWSKFAALTSGVDSVLKKTQGDLDRIKSTSFFQKVPTRVEQEVREREERERREQEQLQREREEKATTEQEQSTAEKLINAVVELDESETNSEAEENDIFDTGYIDAIASGELPIAYVPESPVAESYEGEDPFDTSYADKIIKGPEVSKRGKKLVSIGSAVEVLTGRAECTGSLTKGHRQRRGQQDLLLESFDEGDQQQQQQQPAAAHSSEDKPPLQAAAVAQGAELKSFSLLDESDNFPATSSADLSGVLLQNQYQEQTKKPAEKETSASPKSNAYVDLDEFDELKNREPLDLDGCNLNLTNEEVNGANASNLSAAFNQGSYDLAPSSCQVPEVEDPFDTGFVEKLLPATAVEDDEFDPRAEYPSHNNNLEFDSNVAPSDSAAETLDLFSIEDDFKPFDNTTGAFSATQDLLSGNSSELAEVPQLTPFDCANSSQGKEAEDSGLLADPFDTSNVELIVAPGKAELKYLEEELLTTQTLTHSLSDPDFDPRADSECDTTATAQQQEEFHGPEDDFQSIAQRKSSLSLQITGPALSDASATNRSKSVVFAVPTPDLLKIDVEHSVTKKPLTPYYNRETTSSADGYVDPFDTSFVTSTEPTQLELHLLDQELNSVTLKHSISDPEFDPRADTATVVPQNEAPPSQRSDLLGVSESNQDHHKVLTPANLEEEEADISDPFDTSIALNLGPGRAELKLLEDELIPSQSKKDHLIADILSDGAHEDSSVFVKVLTPQTSRTSLDAESQSTEVDPFDTSFVPNLGPGKAEIKVLESELIDQ